MFKVNLKLSRNDIDVLYTCINKNIYIRTISHGVKDDPDSLIENMQAVDVLIGLSKRIRSMFRIGKNKYSVKLNMTEIYVIMYLVLPVMDKGSCYESMLFRIIREDIYRQIDTQWTAFKGELRVNN